MKKILISTILASAFIFTACEDNLDIEQKGVLYEEDFYQTEEECQQALISAYRGLTTNFACHNGASIYNPFRLCFNLCGDDMFAAGSFLGDNDFAGSLNEFRYDSENQVIKNTYEAAYYAMYYSNLLIKNFKDGLPNGGHTDVTKNAVAEARVIRAYLHFILACGWGTPPQVTDVLDKYAQPKNFSSQNELIKWCAQECVEALPDLKDPSDLSKEEKAVRITKGFANALAGKCYVFVEDWDNAMKYLKEVVESSSYSLVPGEQWADLFHASGDFSSEKIFEVNIENDPSGDWGAFAFNGSNWMFSNIWNWRKDRFVDASMMDNYSGPVDGWGGLGVPKSFADEFIENDGFDSYRLNSSIISVADVMYGKFAGNCLGNVSIEDMKKSDKIGLTEIGLYGQSLYLSRKIMFKNGDGFWPGDNRSQANFIIMRLAEVYLLYAEACVKAGKANEGLPYVQAIQRRANSKTITEGELTMDVIKREKKLELWLEDCRWNDMCRWKDFDGIRNAGSQVTSVFDKVTREIKSDDVVIEDDGRFYSILDPTAQNRSNCGFKDYQALFPFPSRTVLLNPEIKQNPGW